MISCDVILCDMIRYFTIWYDMICISWDKMSDSMSDKFSKHWPHWGSFAGSNLFGGPYWCGLLVGETSEWPQFSFRRDFRLKVFTFRSWIFLNILIYCVYIYDVDQCLCFATGMIFFYCEEHVLLLLLFFSFLLWFLFFWFVYFCFFLFLFFLFFLLFLFFLTCQWGPSRYPEEWAQVIKIVGVWRA